MSLVLGDSEERREDAGDGGGGGEGRGGFHSIFIASSCTDTLTYSF